MKITILNGNPEPSNSYFDDYLSDLSELLKTNGHQVVMLPLRDMDIRRCIGCFGCWVKTPGTCASAKDDSSAIRREVLSSALMIMASPVIMGFPSALLKCAQDKFIPLVLPYIGFYGGECHHHARYDKYPLMSLLLQPCPVTDDEDIEIITDIYRRDAINFKSSLAFSRLTTDRMEDIINEISGI